MISILQRGRTFGQRIVVHVPQTSKLRARAGCISSGCLGISRREISNRAMSTITSKVSSAGSFGIFLLVIPIGTCCLGTWQYQRRKWKLNLIALLQEKTNAPPVDFPQDVYELDDMEYQKVMLRGTFDHDREIFMGPRPLLVGGDVNESGSGLISTGGQSGYLVITPFKLEDRNLTILVNRGWVSRKHKNAEVRPDGQLTGVVSITAVVRKTEDRAPFMPDNSKGSPIFTFRDVNTMAQMTRTAPLCLDAVETFPGGPQGSQTRVTLRNEHLSYMFTWYSLSLATSFMWFQRYIRLKPLM